MKCHSLRVAATIVENGEEKIITEDFKKIDNSRAYDCFKSFFLEYSNQFYLNYSPVPTSLKLFTVTTSTGYDYDDGLKTDVKHEDIFFLLEISKGVNKHDENWKNKEFLALVRWVNIKFLEMEYQTGQKSIIEKSEANDNFNDRANKFQLIQCKRCGKNIEVENNIAKKYLERSSMNKNIVLGCDTCIKVFYKNPMFNFHSYEIYNKIGESQLDEKSNLIDLSTDKKNNLNFKAPVMDEQFKNAIIESAIEKLSSAGKPLSDLELLRGIIHILKKCYGKNDQRHSSKTRFSKEYFKVVVETTDWKKKIVQLPDKKFTTVDKYNEEFAKLKLDAEWDWKNETKEKAIEKLVVILKKVDDNKFEYLVKDVLKNFYPDYGFAVTKRTGDMGIDIIGESADGHDHERIKLIIVQVKRFSNSVDRPEADKFVGAVGDYIKEKYNNVSKLMPIFITSGKYTKGFIDKLKKESTVGRTFRSWDGDELANKMICYGMGIKYSIDLDFWKEIDSTMLPIKVLKKEATD